MNLKLHFIITLFFLIPLWIISIYFKLGITITSIIVGLVFCLFPDFDLKAKTHRNIIAHSIIVWIIIFIFNPSIITVMMIVGTGFHCLEDVKCPSKMLGYACINYIGKKRFNGYYSISWLVGNFVASLIILGVWLVIA